MDYYLGSAAEKHLTQYRYRECKQKDNSRQETSW